MGKRSTTAEFIEKAILKHGDKFDYSKLIYINSREKVCIICPIHREFWQAANSHLQGIGCSKCAFEKIHKAATRSTETFIELSKLKYNETYDYDKTVYVKDKLKVIITCKIHGDFSKTPANHLRGQGCPKCGHILKGLKHTLNTKTFIEKANKVHDFRYDYSETDYVSTHTKVKIICKEHGLFWQQPNSHLNKCGCPECGLILRTSNTNKFIQRAGEVHNNKFNYDKVFYIRHDRKVIITCPEHGDFLQTPNSHLTYGGCMECVERGWSRSAFIKACGNKIPILYVVKMFDGCESFIKIGITKYSTEERFRTFETYDVDEIMIMKDSPDVIWDLEKWLKRNLKPYKYIPQIKFGGCTECFELKSLNIIKQMFKNNEFENPTTN